MHRSTPFLAILGLFFCTQASALPSTEELLKRGTLDLAEVRDIQFKVERITTKDQAVLRERWKMSFLQPSDFRLDFLYPRARVIAANGDELVEFLPEAHQAVRTECREENQRTAFLNLKRKILERASLPGSRLGSVPELLRRFDFKVSEAGAGYRLEGRSEKEKLLLWMNPEEIKQELYDEGGRLLMRQTSKDFRTFGKLTLCLENKTEIMQPERLDLEIRLRDVKINEGMAAGSLHFDPPPGTRIILKTLQ